MLKKLIKNIPCLYSLLLPQKMGIEAYKKAARGARYTWEYYYYGTNFSESIKKFKNRHRGERCFIIGNGPSLKIADLDALKGEICFGTNRIYEIYDKTEWRPTYYCVQDFRLIRQFYDDILTHVNETKNSFIVYNNDCKKYDKRITSMDNIFWFYLNLERYEAPNLPNFSEDSSVLLYEGYTVTYAALQLAVYMGFRYIYLLGIDHSYVPDAKQKQDQVFHYAEGMKPISLAQMNLNGAQLDRSTMAYRKARLYADEHRIKIYNATRGGMLEEFERVDFDDLVGKINAERNGLENDIDK